MFLFLWFCQSSIINISNKGYSFFPIQTNDSIYINLENSNYSTFVYCENDLETEIKTLICYEAGDCYSHFYMGEGGLEINSKFSQITFQSPNYVHIWIIKQSECQSKSISYNTNQNLLDTISLSEYLNSLCIFFPNKNDKIRLKLDTNDKTQKTTFKILTERDLSKYPKSCDKSYCSNTFDDPFYIHLQNITEDALISLEITISKKRESTSCSRSLFSKLNHSQIISSGFITKTSVLTCPEFAVNAYNLNYLLIICGVIFSVIAIVLLCRKFIPKLLGSQPFHNRDVSNGEMELDIEKKLTDGENLVIDTSDL